MTTDDEVNTSYQRNLGRSAANNQEVYDLDIISLDTDFDPSSFMAYFHAPMSMANGEVPRGLALCGYDTVGDAVAEFSTIPDHSGNASLSSEVMPATIDLPTEDLLAGERATGTVSLLQPSETDTRVVLRSAKPDVAHVPPMVTVLAGETSAEFRIHTGNPGRATERVLIQAMLPGNTLFAKLISVRYNLGLAVR